MEPIKQPVQQWWTFHLSWKQQTVIIQGLRAPDSHFCKGIKILSRWLRSIVLNNADKNHAFMCRKKDLPVWEDVENELNYCSLHFVTHFLYAFEIIGYKHPNENIREIAFNYYQNFAKHMCHFNLETEEELDIRLADMEEVPTLFSIAESKGEVVSPDVKICPTPDRYLRIK